MIRKLDNRFRVEDIKIAILVDNCPAHPSVPNFTNILLVFLPPNTISVLDQCVIRSSKAHYRGRVVRMMIRALDKGQPIRRYIRVLGKMPPVKNPPGNFPSMKKSPMKISLKNKASPPGKKCPGNKGNCREKFHTKIAL